MNSRTTFVLTLLLGVASSRPADNFIPSVSIGSGGVSASFGGYHASAGLGGTASGGGAGGGLFAQAGTPDGALASAGLGGKTAGGAARGGLYAGAGLGDGTKAAAGLSGGTVGGAAGGGLYTGVGQGSGHPASKTKTGVTNFSYNITGHKRTGFFDDIFNIPTSVLKAVNQFLNNNAASKQVSTAPVAVHKGAHATFKVQTNVASGSDDKQEGSSHPVFKAMPKTTKEKSASADADATVVTNARISVAKNPGFYDGVFNIPISALNAVNSFLNNLG